MRPPPRSCPGPRSRPHHVAAAGRRWPAVPSCWWHTRRRSCRCRPSLSAAPGRGPAVSARRRCDVTTPSTGSSPSARVRSSLVVLDEGSNAGWRATAGGHLLREVTVDRWRQAFVLPAGGPTVVDIRFAPGRWHRIGLVVGLLALVVLVGLRLALPGQRHRGRDPAVADRAGRAQPTARVLVLAVGGVLGGVIGVAIALAAVVAIRWRRVALGIAAMLYGVAAVARSAVERAVRRSDGLVGRRSAACSSCSPVALDAGFARLPWRRRHRAAPPLEQRPFEQVPGQTGDQRGCRATVASPTVSACPPNRGTSRMLRTASRTSRCQRKTP